MPLPNTNGLPETFTRRGLFRSLGGARQADPVRPPWSLREAAFVAACTGCGDCVRACPQSILTLTSGYPETSFAHAGCNSCGLCADACAPRALDRTAQPEWRHTVAIGTGCLAAQGVVCRICAEQCDVTAIRFRLVVGGKSRPVLNTAACTGCGACIGTCPTQAITITTA